MTIKQAIEYLQPIADSAQLAGYSAALAVAIDAMREVEKYRDAMQEGGLKLLPCKIGEKLWGIRHLNGKGGTITRIAQEGEVTSMLYSRDMELILVLQKIGHRKFGETAFYTREEAERALEEMKHGDE